MRLRSHRERKLLLAFVAVCAVLNPLRSAAQAGSGGNRKPAREYCQARGGYRFQFPRDFFAHPCFKTEWWYFTGNLASSDGRRFGFELTFFREAVDNPYANPSRWRVEDLYLAHFAVSDLGAKKFYYTERLNRAGIELAGADESKGRIWNGGWFAEISGERGREALRDTWRLEAADGGHQIHLRMRSRKAPVLEGDKGLSRKSAGAGDASYYYSLTRLETSGSLAVDGVPYHVTGLAWMDHEFFTHSMAPSQIGWDWVSLQMEDGTEWMLYRFRRSDGALDPYSSGTFIDRDGRTAPLKATDFEMQPVSEWRSPHSGANYPIAWRIRVPRLGFEAQIATAMPDQELVSGTAAGLTYWEGSIMAHGSRNKSPVRGRGYLEMTGYAGALVPGIHSE
jgi:predicted secreted hydrolase